MKCQKDDCYNEAPEFRKFCCDACRKRYWADTHRKERQTSSSEWKRRQYHRADESQYRSLQMAIKERERIAEENTKKLLACTDKNHRYTPPDFEDWKVKAGIVFTVEERRQAA